MLSQVDMRQELKTLINKCMNSVGFEILSREVAQDVRNKAALLPRYDIMLQEYEGFIRDKVFPDLPDTSGRRELLSALLGTRPTAAFFILGHLHRCLKLEGDICEFGVAQGATSALIANEIKDRCAKAFWLFDSFEGLPKPTEADVLIHDIFNLGSMEKYEGTMACPEDMVRGRLKNIGFPDSRLRVVKGFIDKTIHEKNVPDQVAFAYLDFDFYEPLKIALEFLDQRVPSGGVLIVDDYDHFSAGAKKAVEEFAEVRTSTWTREVSPRYAGHFAILKKN